MGFGFRFYLLTTSIFQCSDIVHEIDFLFSDNMEIASKILLTNRKIHGRLLFTILHFYNNKHVINLQIRTLDDIITRKWNKNKQPAQKQTKMMRKKKKRYHICAKDFSLSIFCSYMCKMHMSLRKPAKKKPCFFWYVERRLKVFCCHFSSHSRRWCLHENKCRHFYRLKLYNI